MDFLFIFDFLVHTGIQTTLKKTCFFAFFEFFDFLFIFLIFLKNGHFLKNADFPKFAKICKNLENLANFGKFWKIWQILKISKIHDFDHFWPFLEPFCLVLTLKLAQKGAKKGPNMAYFRGLGP